MKDFVEELKKDKDLQKQVKAALEQVAEKNGCTIHEKHHKGGSPTDCACAVASIIANTL
ncbi:hypothetical protein BH11BAC7_BH11BAC7_25780 [soil metagenome]